MGKTCQVLVVLKRDAPSVQWGFSLVGGADVKTPLIVTRVEFGSPANEALQRGDIITKVGNYDSRDIRHQDAQNLFKNAGNNIRIVVQREKQGRNNPSIGSSRTNSQNYSPLSVSPHLSPPNNYSNSPSNYSPAGSALTPYYSSPLTPIDRDYFEPVYITPGDRKKKEQQDIHVTKQPFRTTPLVLPGAKIKHPPQLTECYLRHHPNPAVRVPPYHYDSDYLIKQKVANSVLERISTGDPHKQIVHKQFNSPIGLYSEPNVVDTFQKQAGISPGSKHVKFNPATSETYKAIQEEQYNDHYVQEYNTPAQTRVFVPNKSVPSKKPPLIVNQNVPYGDTIREEDEPRQSGSFRRLMWSVMPESSY